jgi:hypothetical protein
LKTRQEEDQSLEIEQWGRVYLQGVRGFLQGGRNQEGVDSSIQPTTEWGCIERKNRSIIGVAKAMIHDQDLPMFLWVEACNTTVYIQKLVSSQDLGGQDTRGGIHWCEARGESFPHLWLSSLYPCIGREEDQVGALQQEGFICGLQ